MDKVLAVISTQSYEREGFLENYVPLLEEKGIVAHVFKNFDAFEESDIIPGVIFITSLIDIRSRLKETVNLLRARHPQAKIIATSVNGTYGYGFKRCGGDGFFSKGGGAAASVKIVSLFFEQKE